MVPTIPTLALWFFAFALTANVPDHELGDGAAQSPAPSAEASPEPLTARVAVLGASVSGGWDLARTYRAKIDFSHVLRAGLASEDAQARAFADTWLFSAPLRIAAPLVEAARAYKPTLVVALDFPFWFGYGAPLTEEERIELLDKGLALLENFEVPVVVGDFPDMRAATSAVSHLGIPMLREPQVPTPQTLARLNARMAEWTAARKNRVLVSMDAFHRALTSGGEVTVRGNRWQGADLGKLLLEDQLHPSVEGQIALGLSIFDALVRAELGLAGDEIVWDAKGVRARLDEATREEREQALERDRKQEERRRAREERDVRQGSLPRAPLRPAA